MYLLWIVSSTGKQVWGGSCLHPHCKTLITCWGEQTRQIHAIKLNKVSEKKLLWFRGVLLAKKNSGSTEIELTPSTSSKKELSEIDKFEGSDASRTSTSVFSVVILAHVLQFLYIVYSKYTSVPAFWFRYNANSYINVSTLDLRCIIWKCVLLKVWLHVDNFLGRLC